MESKSRIELIRERHRKLILEPRERMEYALQEDWEEEPALDEEEVVGKIAQVDGGREE